MATSAEILEHWFGTAELKSKVSPRKEWFGKDAAFDDELRAKFGADVEKAAAGELVTWREEAPSSVALVLLLDQFPRNLYRGTAQAFATDSKGLEVALYALDRQFDQAISPVARWFLYMPLVHSETLTQQEDGLRRFQALAGSPASSQAIEAAQKHLTIIQKFGRFPSRNEILGRESTAEELEFLKTEGSSI
ncbi:MAG: hypothetical protein JWM74_1778 [Myxococcaceae bacterium]|jgi:uncharacterized protein (DUF924 family)|nr:hypothetical protein [Myxococcaceae bacterium]